MSKRASGTDESWNNLKQTLRRVYSMSRTEMFHNISTSVPTCWPMLAIVAASGIPGSAPSPSGPAASPFSYALASEPGKNESRVYGGLVALFLAIVKKRKNRKLRTYILIGFC